MKCPKCDKSGVLECIEMEKVPGLYRYRCVSCGVIVDYENGKSSYVVEKKDNAPEVVKEEKGAVGEVGPVQKPMHVPPVRNNIKHNYEKPKRR